LSALDHQTHCPHCKQPIGEVLTCYPPKCAKCRKPLYRVECGPDGWIELPIEGSDPRWDGGTWQGADGAWQDVTPPGWRK
jgi:hypothetical protein